MARAKKSKKPIIPLVILMVLALGGILYFGRQAVRQPAAVKAPDFSIKTFDGETVSLKSMRGKPLFLNFWSSW